MPATTIFPPFPDDVPTHPLLVVDYKLLVAGDKDEIEKLWKAATELGFWYLNNHGVDDEVAGMFEMGETTMQLPQEEKIKYEQGADEGGSFGYKAAGTNAVNEYGDLDSTEFLNIAKDDALRWPSFYHRTYPSTVNERMESIVRPFVIKSLEVNETLINILNDKLGLPTGTLAALHNMEEISGCAARYIQAPPQFGQPSEKVLLSAHTDFGSLSFLHNRLGGLQVLSPGADRWCYIKPLPGHAVCNLGDAMYFFSGGILKSNIHRVVPPPKGQAAYQRSSLVFFTRPVDTVRLHALSQDSPLIADAIKHAPEKQFDAGVTAKDWLAQRIKAQRIKNYKGPEVWLANRGTENQRVIALTSSKAEMISGA